MIKQIVRFKTVFALLVFWLLCQNSFGWQAEPVEGLAQASNFVDKDYKLVTDTLIKDEQRRIESVKKREEMEQQKEALETELATTKELEKYVQEVPSRTMSQKPAKERRRRESSSNNERAVVFGIRGGANFASLGLDGDADGKCSMVTSFHAGLNLDIRLIDQLHLNTSLLFSQKGYKYEHEWDSERQETVTAQFVMLPVQLSLRFGAFQLNAGPYVEYGLGGEIEYGQRGWTHDTFDYYDALNYGIAAGIGINLGKHFYMGANYEMGLSDYANRNIAVSLGVNF